jgi:hypothetical protein
MTTERDIDLVLITGAGASRDLASPNDHFPLMGDWSQALSKHFGSKGPQYFDLVDLRSVTDGQEFETRLGTFLQQVQGFNACKDLLKETGALPGIPAPFIGTQTLEQWTSAIGHALKSATSLIHESLVQEFGIRSCNVDAGRTAYSSLLGAFGIIPAKNKWVYATTNYDRNAERILGSLGYRPDAGVDHQEGNSGYGTLSVDGIIQDIGARRVPILHLHGCVGWYQRANGEVYHQHQGSFGAISYDDVPIVKLPDPGKVYDPNDIIGQTWSEFRQSLVRAKSVFVLGHSLSDPGLIEAIRTDVTPLKRLAIGVYGTDQNFSQFGPGGNDVSERAKEFFGSNVTIVPIRFGGVQRNETTSALADWKRDSKS